MAPNGIRHKAGAVKQQIPRPRPQLSVSKADQVATANDILLGFCFQDQGNVS